MDSQTKKSKSDDLEVTGVSRSGRVQRKSSKLVDFESPDDSDNLYERTPNQRKTSENHEPILSPQHSQSFEHPKSEEVYIKQENIKQELEYEDLDLPRCDSDFEPDFDDLNDGSSMDSLDSRDGINEKNYDLRRLDKHTNNDQPAQSLCLMEKSSRKCVAINDRHSFTTSSTTQLVDESMKNKIDTVKKIFQSTTTMDITTPALNLTNCTNFAIYIHTSK